VAATPSKYGVTKPKTPKTPASGRKRKRETDSETEMSDGDLPDAPLSKEELAKLPTRNTSRRRKTPKNYTYTADSDDATDAETTKSRFIIEEQIDCESDVSDFSPFD
jgi:hypothetical protein